MILICCIEDALGMAFSRRRVSRDRAVCEDILREAGSSPIWMDVRSTVLFRDMGGNIITEPDFALKASRGEYCFLEFSAPAQYEEKAEKLILYRWNRRYPSDLKFDIDLGSWSLETSCDFVGSSHDTITKEVYIRE